MGPGCLRAADIKRLPGRNTCPIVFLYGAQSCFFRGGFESRGVINSGLTSDVPFSVESGDFARCLTVRSRLAGIKPGNVSTFSEKWDDGAQKRHFSRLQRL